MRTLPKFLACVAAMTLRSCAEKAKELEEKQQKKKRKGKQQRASEEEQQAGRGRKKGALGAECCTSFGICISSRPRPV